MAPLPTEPVHLIEDAATGDRFLVYGTEKGLRVELRYEGETLWVTTWKGDNVTQARLAETAFTL